MEAATAAATRYAQRRAESAGEGTAADGEAGWRVENNGHYTVTEIVPQKLTVYGVEKLLHYVEDCSGA